MTPATRIATTLDGFEDLRAALAGASSRAANDEEEPIVTPRSRARHSRSGRTRLGTIERAGEHPDGTPRLRFRLRLADGCKSRRLEVPPGMSASDARAFVSEMQALEDAHHRLLSRKRAAATGVGSGRVERSAEETWDAWFARYLPTKECGEGHRRITLDDEGRAGRWHGHHACVGPERARGRCRGRHERLLDRHRHRSQLHGRHCDEAHAKPTDVFGRAVGAFEYRHSCFTVARSSSPAHLAGMSVACVVYSRYGQRAPSSPGDEARGACRSRRRSRRHARGRGP